MTTNLVAIALILLASLWRGLAVYEPSLFNIAPVGALASCGAVYWRDRRWWPVPFAAHSRATNLANGFFDAR